MNIISSNAENSFAPKTLMFHVILHQVVVDRLEFALLSACDHNGLVTAENYPVIEALVEIINVLDDPDLPCPGHDHTNPTDISTVRIGDSIEAWMHEKFTLRRDLSRGPLALVVGRAGWRNLDTCEMISATNPDK